MNFVRRILFIVAIALAGLVPSQAMAGDLEDDCSIELIDELTVQINQLEENIASIRERLKTLDPDPELIEVSAKLDGIDNFIVGARGRVAFCRNLNEWEEVKVIAAR